MEKEDERKKKEKETLIFQGYIRIQVYNCNKKNLIPNNVSVVKNTAKKFKSLFLFRIFNNKRRKNRIRRKKKGRKKY